MKCRWGLLSHTSPALAARGLCFHHGGTEVERRENVKGRLFPDPLLCASATLWFLFVPQGTTLQSETCVAFERPRKRKRRDTSA